MRLNTKFIFFSIFLSLSVAAPIAQYSEVASTASPIDNGIDSSLNSFRTGTSSPYMEAYLMATRRQREDKSRRRPSTQPQMRPPIPHQDDCLGDSSRQGCQQEEVPGTSPAPGQTDIPDPWLDEPAQAGATAAGALGLWELLDLLNNPSSASFP